jgi:hypothetical protein
MFLSISLRALIGKLLKLRFLPKKGHFKKISLGSVFFIFFFFNNIRQPDYIKRKAHKLLCCQKPFDLLE